MYSTLSKANYVATSLSKIKHKRWELYVISRVIHLLNDLDVEFICQQAYSYDHGRRRFALVFPQFNIYLEVNERGGHSKDVDQKLDKIRHGEILRAVGARQEKIENFSFDEQGNVTDSTLDEIQKIDKFVALLKEHKQEQLLRAFEPWDPAKKYDPDKFLEKGYLDVAENPSFLTHKDALRCFRYNKGHYQRAAWRAKLEKSVCLVSYFIKHRDWLNTFTEDEKVIKEIMLSSDADTRQRIEATDTRQVRYTFAKTRDKLGNTLYRFVGVFKTVSKSERHFRPFSF